MTVPVLLHLLMRGKPKKIEFPALMFVKKHLETHRRHYQIKQLILLALRMLILLLFGLALARPTIKLADWLPASTRVGVQKETGQRSFVSSLAASLGSQDAPIAAAIVVDSSPRMEYVAENQSRLEVARDFSHWILAQLPQDSDIAVLSSERETPVFQVDRLAAAEKIDRLQITPLGRPVTETLREALTLLAESELPQRELYVVSDLSEPGWPGDFGESLKNRIEGMKSGANPLGTGTQELGVFVVDVSADTPVNSSVIRFSLVPELAAEKSPVRVDVELAHSGPALTKTVELLLAGLDPQFPEKEVVRNTKTVDFPDGDSRKHISFTLSGFAPGTHQGKLRFSMPDALPVDDQAWFTVQVQKPWKLLLLAPPPLWDRTLFLREALAPRDALEPTPFTVETAALADLPGLTATELSQYRAVFLLDPPPLGAVVWKKLADYAASGRGVGLMLGSSILGGSILGGTANFHNAANDAASQSAAQEMLGAKLLRQARDPDGATWLTVGHGNSPIFSPFRQIQPLAQFPWEAQPVFRYWEIPELSPAADVAATFSDGRPAVLTQTRGRGRVLTMLTPVSEISALETSEERLPWNLLTRGEAAWMFVLLADGMARFLVGMEESQFNVQAGETAVLRPDLETLPATCPMSTPSGKSVRLSPDVARREIIVTETQEPGHYRIRAGGATESLDTGFSANISGELMTLRKIAPSRLDDLLGGKNYRLVRTPQEIELGIARRRMGQELYALLMLMLAVLFIGEYIFSNRFYGAKISPE